LSPGPGCPSPPGPSVQGRGPSLGYQTTSAAVSLGRRPSASVSGRQSRSAVVSFRRLPSASVGCLQLPSAAFSFRRLPSASNAHLPSAGGPARRVRSRPVTVPARVAACLVGSEKKRARHGGTKPGASYLRVLSAGKESRPLHAEVVAGRESGRPPRMLLTERWPAKVILPFPSPRTG
jgi:hypothetical protein